MVLVRSYCDEKLGGSLRAQSFARHTPPAPMGLSFMRYGLTRVLGQGTGEIQGPLPVQRWKKKNVFDGLELVSDPICLEAERRRKIEAELRSHGKKRLLETVECRISLS